LKLLLFSDLHADAAAARRIVALAEQADVLVGAGDFGNVRRQLDVSLDVLSRVAKPAVLVAGNNESTEELVAACAAWPTARVLHGSSAVVQGLTFFGLGGGVPITPFGAWSYDLSEDEASDLLEACPPDCVLVTHSPPKGAVDLSSSGQGLGSAAVREAVLRVRPRLVVCGHIHGSGGQRGAIGPTPVVNAGPAGVWWEL
jgi:Icc-related predicted phosphoesterase